MRALVLVAMFIPVAGAALAAAPSPSALALGIGEPRIWSVPAVGASVQFSVTKVIDPVAAYGDVRPTASHRLVAVCDVTVATSRPLSMGDVYLQGSDGVDYVGADYMQNSTNESRSLSASVGCEISSNVGRGVDLSPAPNGGTWRSVQVFEIPNGVRAAAVFFRPDTEFFAGTVAGARAGEWVIR